MTQTPIEVAELVAEAEAALWWAEANQHPGVASTVRNLADRVESQAAEIERLRAGFEMLKDPQVVHINIMRGGIAKLTPGHIGHLYRGDEAVEVVNELTRQQGLTEQQLAKHKGPQL